MFSSGDVIHSSNRRHRRTWFVAMALLVGLVLGASLVAGCGSSGDGGTAKPSTEPSKTESQILPGEDSDEYGPVAGGIAKGDIDELTWALGDGEPITLVPWNSAASTGGAFTVANLCDTIVQMAPDGSIIPALATEWEQRDPLTLVFQFRDDVKFWDGKPLTAEDVAYSLNIMASDESAGSVFFTNVDTMKATGPLEVTIKFKEPDELFMKELPTFSGGIIQKEWAEKVGKDMGTSKAGLMATGPLKFDHWTPGQEIVLVRNDDYWNPLFRSRAARVTLKFVPDSTALANGLASGALDGAWEIPAAIIPRLEKATEGKLYSGPSPIHIGFMRAQPGGVLGDIRVANAISLSLDRQAMAETILKGAGGPSFTRIPAYSWDPETVDMWKADYEKYKTAYGFDLEAAKKLLAETDYAGEEIVLAIPAGDITQSQIAQYMQAQAKLIGVNVTIKPMQSVQYNDAMQSAEARKGIDLFMGRYWNAAVDPIEQLVFDLDPTSSYNYTKYNNPEAIDLLAKARRTYDAVERTKYLLRLQEIYEADLGNLSLLDLDEISFLNNRLAGMPTSFHFLFIPSLTLIGAAQ